ncbi:MAG: hypothetical protein QOF88_4188 [Mycobacterium sp.]|nr:hypothetical protein [Mycobacterium sp.]
MVRVPSESPLSGSHLTEAASALSNKPPGADPRAALRIDWAAFVTNAIVISSQRSGARRTAISVRTTASQSRNTAESNTEGYQ